MVTVREAYEKLRAHAMKVMGLTEFPFEHRYGEAIRNEYDSLVEYGTSKYMAYIWVGDTTADALSFAFKLMNRKYRQAHAED